MIKIFFILFFIGIILSAQDSHQWNIFPGNEASLLGAASLAGVNDYSTAYYNPGNLGKLNKNFSLTGNLFSAQEIKSYNGAGENNDIYTYLFNIIPNMTAGPLPFQFDKNGKFGYLIFEKQFDNNYYSYLKQEYADLIPDLFLDAETPVLFAGDEFYSGEMTFEKYLTEYWAGISWGHSSGNWGIGFTFFSAIRNQKNSFELYSVAADLDNDIAMTTNLRYTLDYFDVRLLMKSGISYEDEDFRFGLTYTSPSVHLYGRGSLGGNISSTGIFFRDDNDNVEGPYDFIATDKEDHIPTNYRSPWSIGLGFVKKFETTEIGLGAEYFADLSLGMVISPESNKFIITNPGDDDTWVNGKLILLTTYQRSKEILNFGFSVKHDLSQKFSGYLNFNTDFSTTPKRDEELIYVNNELWNIYHIAMGAIYKTKKTLIGTTIQYSFSRDKNLTSFTNLNSHPLENNEMFLINNNPTSMDIRYNRILITIGITYFIEPSL